VSAKLFVSTEDIKVRKSKGARVGSLGVIKKGTIIDVTELDEQWGVVEFGEKQGYIKTKNLRAAAAPPTSSAPPPLEPDNSPGPVSILVFVAITLIVVFLIKKLATANKFSTLKHLRSKKPGQGEGSDSTMYWYQCKYCAAVVKKTDAPSDSGCLRSKHHLWVWLGEVGPDKYFCKNCQTTVQTKGTPNPAGCPKGEFHMWLER